MSVLRNIEIDQYGKSKLTAPDKALFQSKSTDILFFNSSTKTYVVVLI